MALLKSWKLKALLQRALWRLPGGVRLNTLLSHLRAGHQPEIESLQKHAPNLRRHLQALRELRPPGHPTLSALEIGTGWDFDVATLLRLCGFEQVTTVDAFRHVRLRQALRCLALLEQPAHELQTLTGRREPPPHDFLQRLGGSTSMSQFCEAAGIRYVAPVSPGYVELSDDSMDFCCSTAVFEHIRPADARAILTATRKKLNESGCTSHVIDLKDHFAYFEPGLPYNHFLRFSEREWNRIAGNPLAYTNRMSASQWRRLFTETGYEILKFETVEERVLQPLPVSLIHAENRTWTAEDLRIGEIHVVAQRAR